MKPKIPAAWRTKTTVSVPEAGAILGFGRDGAYEAAKRKEIPVLEFGRLKRVPVAALIRMLETGERPASA